MSFVFESNSRSTRTSFVRSFIELRRLWAVYAKFEWRVTAHNSLWHRSALLVDDWQSQLAKKRRAIIGQSQGGFGQLWLRGGLEHAPHYKRQPARRPRVVCSGLVKERSSQTVREREIDRDRGPDSQSTYAGVSRDARRN